MNLKDVRLLSFRIPSSSFENKLLSEQKACREATLATCRASEQRGTPRLACPRLTGHLHSKPGTRVRPLGGAHAGLHGTNAADICFSHTQ